MRTNCLRCKTEYETTKGYCRTCYELALLKGQCLNIAGTVLTENFNPEHPIFLEKLFKLAKDMYEEGKKQRFLEW